MRYKPQPKREIGSQIFSFCLADKMLGNSARLFEGSLSKQERKYSAGMAMIALIFFRAREDGHDSGL